MPYSSLKRFGEILEKASGLEEAVFVERMKDDPYQRQFVELPYMLHVNLHYTYFADKQVTEGAKRLPLGWFGGRV